MKIAMKHIRFHNFCKASENSERGIFFETKRLKVMIYGFDQSFDRARERECVIILNVCRYLYVLSFYLLSLIKSTIFEI